MIELLARACQCLGMHGYFFGGFYKGVLKGLLGGIPLLIPQILHDLNIQKYHNSQGIMYLGSCRMFSIPRRSLDYGSYSPKEYEP